MREMSRFVLRPVVEAPRTPQAFWCPLPPEPWPDFVELSSSATHAEVALVLLQLATYNRKGAGAPLQPAELLAAEALVLPGGLMAGDGEQVIAPSCCCGLEGWAEWWLAIDDGSSPWLGHDPSPWLERQDDRFRLWPDEVTPERAADTPIRFTTAELQAQLERVPATLEGFLPRLREVLIACAPAEADALATVFARTFVRSPAGQTGATP